MLYHRISAICQTTRAKLDTESIEAASVVHIFSQWGLAQLLFGFFYVIVLWRYQALIPLVYLFFAIEYTGRLLLGFAKPIETK